MIGDPYPTILSPGFGIPLSLLLNFAAPFAAYLFSRRLKGYKWWPHVVACCWEIISIFVFAILLLPAIPADEAPGPGDGFLLFPTVLSAAAVLLGYCIALIWKLFTSLARI
jgi:hypothetical protein